VSSVIALEGASGFIHTLASAQRIALTAYTLRAGPVLDALAAAARRGAAVSVRLERDPFDDPHGGLHRANAEALGALRRAGAHAEATKPGDAPLHLKAAVVDGVAWLDDRNWASGGAERIVRDTDPADVAAVAAAVAGGPGSDPHLATTKAGAQDLEAAMIARAGPSRLDVESESFAKGRIYDALLHRAEAHLPTRLIVAGREAREAGNRTERAHLKRLAALGVEVRLGHAGRGDLDEKLAVAAGNAWIGSANATYARGPAGAQRDWGLTTSDPAMIDGLRTAFEQNWTRAQNWTHAQALPPLSSRALSRDAPQSRLPSASAKARAVE
jgi:phosphatidylserine/phosphatidylglycerophosphate/cardiolipin synthase-like enzyme